MAFVFDVLLFHEPVDWLSVVGATMIGASCIMLGMSEDRSAPLEAKMQPLEEPPADLEAVQPLLVSARE